MTDKFPIVILGDDDARIKKLRDSPQLQCFQAKNWEDVSSFIKKENIRAIVLDFTDVQRSNEVIHFVKFDGIWVIRNNSEHVVVRGTRPKTEPGFDTDSIRNTLLKELSKSIPIPEPRVQKSFSKNPTVGGRVRCNKVVA